MNRYQAIVKIVRSMPPHQRFDSEILGLLVFAMPMIASEIMFWRSL